MVGLVLLLMDDKIPTMTSTGTGTTLLELTTMLNAVNLESI